MSSVESEAIDALLKLSFPCDTNLELPAIRPQERTNVSLPNLSSLLNNYSDLHERKPSSLHQVAIFGDDYLNKKRAFLKSLTRAASVTVRISRPKKKKARNEPLSCASSVISDASCSKPRWQESERLDLLEAIVKEKQLDDMKTIRWDRIAISVGKAKKACKDQWRREILPNLMKNLKSTKYKS